LGTYPSRSDGSGRNNGSRARQHLGGVALVEQRRADRVFADRADAVHHEQPTFIELDRRSAVADLHELPGKLRLQDSLTIVPSVKVVRIDQIQILVILPRPDLSRAYQSDMPLVDTVHKFWRG